MLYLVDSLRTARKHRLACMCHNSTCPYNRQAGVEFSSTMMMTLNAITQQNPARHDVQMFIVSASSRHHTCSQQHAMLQCVCPYAHLSILFQGVGLNKAELPCVPILDIQCSKTTSSSGIICAYVCESDIYSSRQQSEWNV